MPSTRSLSSAVFSSALLLLFLLPHATLASVTIYNQFGQGSLASATASGSAASYTGAAAYNPTTLQAPDPPSNPPLNTQFTVNIQNSASAVVNLSIPQGGYFFGFSVETSIVNQVFGLNSSFLQVPFLNLMANLQSRGGKIRIRVGGNTQETAVLVPSTPDGKILEKDLSGVTNPTQTPPLIFTPELIYMLGNISHLIDIEWFLGIPFNDTTDFRLGIAEVGQAVLGNKLIGLQAGNEPDLYATHLHRPTNYSQFDYFGEFGELINVMAADPNIKNQSQLIGPSVASGPWSPESVWDTGFVANYSAQLAYLAVEHYPTDNCFAAFGGAAGVPQDPQALFPTYLNHTAGKAIVGPYLNSTNFAQQNGKELLMFETNTASCGGFPGISNTFGAALWGLDYGMQMAFVNFSGALFHVGGQSVYYNPFTPPPTNQSLFHQWTIGPIYYSALVMAEALGPTGTAQVFDLAPNNDSMFTPGYAIYESGTLARVMLFNYVSDATHANDVTANISLAGSGQVPSSVKVKYLQAPSVSQIGNITWAGQTFGNNFGSDGRLQGTEQIQTVTCDTTNNLCAIPVPGPSVALVFLNSGLTETEGAPSTTFATTSYTRTQNTATVDPSVLVTSNGHGGSQEVLGLGSTSKGSVKSGAGRVMASALVGVVVGGVMVLARGLVR